MVSIIPGTLTHRKPFVVPLGGVSLFQPGIQGLSVNTFAVRLSQSIPPTMNYSNLDTRLKARTLSESFLKRLELIREASVKAVQKAREGKGKRPAQAAV